MHVACVVEWRGAYRVLVGKPEGKRPLRGPRLGCDGHIKMDLQDVDLVMDWIDLAQDRGRWREVVIAAMKLWVQQNAVHFLTS